MKTIKIILVLALLVGIAPVSFASSAKYTNPNFDAPQGKVTTYEKGYEGTQEYNSKLIANYDKQHKPWFENTLKVQNAKR